MKTHVRITVAAVACMVLVSGCFWAVELDRVRREIERQVPGAEFEREFAISLGPVSLLFARAVTGLVPDAKEAHEMLAEVRRVKVAVYEVRSMPRDAVIETPRRLSDLLERRDWEMAVRVRDRDESVWVLFREKDERVRDVYVVALDGHELVMVHASGNMNRLLRKAVEADFDVRRDLGLDLR